MKKFLLILLVPINVFCVEINLKTDAFSIIEKNEFDESELPTVWYNFFNGYNPNINAGLNLDFQVFVEPVYQESDLSLYESFITLGNSDTKANLKLGRLSNMDGFQFNTLDGGRFEFSPDFPLRFILSTGVSRELDHSKFVEGNYNVSAGLALKDIENISANFYFMYEYDFSESVDFAKLAFDFSHQFSFSGLPKFYTLLEYNPTYRVFENFTVGLSLIPSDRVFLDLPFSIFDSQRENEIADNDILREYTRDKLYNVHPKVDLTITKNIGLFSDYSVSYYDYSTTSADYTHTLKTGLALKDKLDESNLILMYIYNRSYGGTSFGADLDAILAITKKMSIKGNASLHHYDKITGEIGEVFSSLLGASYKILTGLVLSLNGEFNSNDEFEEDIRGMINVAYKY
jgi:hypothetical protein